jgi:pimeloyl-ACP methyl ester carboxylesterase
MGANVVERLEDRLMFAADASTVTLTRADGATRSVVGRRDTWVIIHGLGASKGDDQIKRLARAVDAMSPRDQVLVVDWSGLAFATDDPFLAESNAQAAAGAVATKIRAIGLPASRINLIGYSMGGYVAAQIAADLHGEGGVNRIVALDPAAPRTGVNKKGHRVPVAVNFTMDSEYAIAFHGVDRWSQFVTATSADDTVRLDNIGADDDHRHAAVIDLFSTMVERNNAGNADAVSRVFSLARIKDGAVPGWRRDQFGVDSGAGYEAVLTATPSPLAPTLLTYVNRRGHTVHVS